MTHSCQGYESKVSCAGVEVYVVASAWNVREGLVLSSEL